MANDRFAAEDGANPARNEGFPDYQGLDLRRSAIINYIGINNASICMISFLFALILVVSLLACWFVTVLGMPGNWLMVTATAVYACLVSAQSPAALGWRTVVALFVLAALGEVVELVAGALGVAKAGGSRRGALMALMGSIIGGILGIFLGTPIPVVGSIVGAVLFAGLGAMAGAVLGEMWAGRNLDATWRIAKLAFWGRLAGTLGKILLGAVMVAVVVAALLS